MLTEETFLKICLKKAKQFLITINKEKITEKIEEKQGKIENYRLTNKGKKLLGIGFEETLEENVKSWIEDYYAYFISVKDGIPTGQNEFAARKKMIKWISSFYKDTPYNEIRDEILEATQIYTSKTDPKYTQQARYFVTKYNPKTGTTAYNLEANILELRKTKEKREVFDEFV